MSGDGSEYTSLSHEIAKGAEMAIVDVNVISAKNHSQFFDQTIPGGLYTKSLQDLNNMITGGPGCINSLY